MGIPSFSVSFLHSRLAQSIHRSFMYCRRSGLSPPPLSPIFAAAILTRWWISTSFSQFSHDWVLSGKFPVKFLILYSSFRSFFNSALVGEKLDEELCLEELCLEELCTGEYLDFCKRFFNSSLDKSLAIILSLLALRRIFCCSNCFSIKRFRPSFISLFLRSATSLR